jgi:hypothetical protein
LVSAAPKSQTVLVVVEERVLEEVVIVRGQTNRQTNKLNWQTRLVVVGGYSLTVMKNKHNGRANGFVRKQYFCSSSSFTLQWMTHHKEKKKKHNNNISQGLWLAVAHEVCPCCCCCSWDPFIFPSTSSSFMSSSSSLKNSFTSLLFACSSRLYVAPLPFLIMLQTS